MKVGIVGGGQLGRMLGLAGIPLGIECEFLDSSATAPAAAVGKIHVGQLDDEAAILSLAQRVSTLTTEIENISTAAFSGAARYCSVAPRPEAVAAAQDRLIEKTLFRQLGIETAPFVALSKPGDLDQVSVNADWPKIIKTRRLGYDGRGQAVVRSHSELAHAYKNLGAVPSIIEDWIGFDRELSLIGVRDRAGAIRFYPLCENVHINGILSTTVAPYDDSRLQLQAETSVARIMNHFDYVGVLTVEFFHTAGGLVANEMAPRVHNSGHWTIEGAETSQFENHLRAVTGLPLGSTKVRGCAAMLNLVSHMPDRPRVLQHEGVHLHDYGKSARPDRKLGHCTLVDDDRKTLISRLEALQSLIVKPNS